MAFYNNRNLAAYFSLFTSAGTLICCALPALLVTLGMGAALAGLVSNVPWLIALSTHKEIVFGIAGLMLAAASFMQWKNRNAPCPIDPAQARACTRLRKINIVILSLSIFIYLTGFFFAFIAVHLFY